MALLLQCASRSWPASPFRAVLTLLLWWLCLCCYALLASAVLLPSWAAYHTLRYVAQLSASALLRKMGFHWAAAQLLPPFSAAWIQLPSGLEQCADRKAALPPPGTWRLLAS